MTKSLFGGFLVRRFFANGLTGILGLLVLLAQSAMGQLDKTGTAPRADQPAGASLESKGVSHPNNGASVQNIGAISTDILGVEIQEKEFKPGKLIPTGYPLYSSR